MSALGAEGEPEWRTAVEVAEDPELSQLLLSRLPPDGSLRAVSVTDLTGLRPAYWSAVRPVPTSPERHARFAVGRAVHRGVGSALSDRASLEVRVRRAGIVGRIDLLSDEALVEIKTTGSIVPAAQLLPARPDQIEQVAMYAALADREQARLLTLRTDGESIGEVQAVDLVVGDRPEILVEMGRRRDVLRRAWRDRRPDALPRCRWFGRGCEFQETAVCGCTGTESPEGSEILARIRSIEDRPDAAAEVRAVVGDGRFPPARLERFRDLLYPRRTYYERTAGHVESEPLLSDPNGPADLYERLRESIESGPVRECASRPVRADEPDEDVPAFRGDPWIERVTRSWQSPTASDLIERYPQYVLELAFRCVATGSNTGRLVVGWERAPRETERIRTLAVRLADPTAIARLWRERVARLEQAIREVAPRSLPACPSWMPARCPYVTVCGCGDPAGRSQR